MLKKSFRVVYSAKAKKIKIKIEDGQDRLKVIVKLPMNGWT